MKKRNTIKVHRDTFEKLSSKNRDNEKSIL